MATAANAAGAGALQVSVISPEKVIFEGSAESLVAPAWNGELGILSGHAPLMALLGDGTLRISAAGATQQFHLAGGFLQVVDNVVTVLTERAEAEAA